MCSRPRTHAAAEIDTAPPRFATAQPPRAIDGDGDVDARIILENDGRPVRTLRTCMQVDVDRSRPYSKSASGRSMDDDDRTRPVTTSAVVNCLHACASAANQRSNHHSTLPSRNHHSLSPTRPDPVITIIYCAHVCISNSPCMLLRSSTSPTSTCWSMHAEFAHW